MNSYSRVNAKANKQAQLRREIKGLVVSWMLLNLLSLYCIPLQADNFQDSLDDHLKIERESCTNEVRKMIFLI